MTIENPASSRKRGPQIIRLLNTHGPLNTAAIQSLLEPRIDRRRLNDAISRLVRRGIVVRRFQGLFQQSHDQYYQLSARNEHQAEIGDVIGVDPNIFRMPRVRNQDLFHSIGCAHLAESLAKAFPDGEVIREFHILEHPAGKKAHLTSLEGEKQLLPDMILSLPEDEKHRELNIAFEFERSKKATIRLGQKMHRYAAWTRIHGVVWMCEDNGIQRDLCRAWLRQEEKGFLRLSKLFDYFQLFTTNPKIFHADDWMFNARGIPTKLSHWIDILGRKDLLPLDDKHFQLTSEEPACPG